MRNEGLFKPLLVFCKVAEYLSISKAGEALNVTQPAVSNSIAILEKRLDCLLFERRRPHLILTPDGEALLKLARPLVEEVNLLPERFWNNRGVIKHGTIHIAAIENISLYFLPKISKQFSDLYPHIKLRFKSVVAQDIPDLVASNQVDFALGSLVSERDDLRQTPFYHFSPALLMPKGHPLANKPEITLADIANYPIITPPRSSYIWQMMELIFAQHNLNYDVRIETSGTEMAKRFVKEGLGITILSAVPDSELVAREINYFPKRSYCLIERRGKLHTPQADKFKDLLLSIKE